VSAALLTHSHKNFGRNDLLTASLHGMRMTPITIA
jgi:hypothetical protein